MWKLCHLSPCTNSPVVSLPDARQRDRSSVGTTLWRGGTSVCLLTKVIFRFLPFYTKVTLHHTLAIFSSFLPFASLLFSLKPLIKSVSFILSVSGGLNLTQELTLSSPWGTHSQTRVENWSLTAGAAPPPKPTLAYSQSMHQFSKLSWVRGVFLVPNFNR